MIIYGAWSVYNHNPVSVHPFKGHQKCKLQTDDNLKAKQAYGKYVYTYDGNPQPSFLGLWPIYWGFKTFIFHGFGVQGSNYLRPFWDDWVSEGLSDLELSHQFWWPIESQTIPSIYGIFTYIYHEHI